MDNYALSRDAARRHFLEYASRTLAQRPGVREAGTYFTTSFLGAETRIDKQTGLVTFSWDGFETCWEASYCEALAVYDWLCDAKPGAQASGDFCPVTSLPGVYVGGSGLSMTGGSLPQAIEQAPESFRSAMQALGGEALPLGDLGFRLQVFPDLPMCLKFYYGDEDFPPSLTFLWDRNTLDFVRYETVYYIAGCLQARVDEQMKGCQGPE